MKLVKDAKVICGEEIAAQHHLLVCDLRLQTSSTPKSRFTPRRKIWKLKGVVIKLKFATVFASAPLREGDVQSVENLWSWLMADFIIIIIIIFIISQCLYRLFTFQQNKFLLSICYLLPS